MTPFLAKISSASGVIGPLAISIMALALILDALSLWITFSRAAGTKISTSNSSNSSLVMAFG